MSLYQTVRPDKLEDIVGNSSTVGALKNMLRKPLDSRPHTVLLKGPSGCGKTTIARILAKEFESTESSIFELNAANTNGISTIREVANNAFLSALGGGSKTYIFDESHELTGKAQEALLKVLEDNPPHCYFIFCTTSPESLIKTIRNRCTEYAVDLLRPKEIIEVLKRAYLKTEIKSSQPQDDIVEAISLTCEGSPRAALVSLEQVMEEEDVDVALELLVRGTEKDAKVIDLLKLLIMAPEQRRKKWKLIITTFDAISEDSERIRKSVLTFLYNKLVKSKYSEKDAMDVAHLLRIFSVNTFYGKKSLLGALIVRACFESWRED